ncbi:MULTISPECIES: hypothetical protein [unclassified Micromonospora]|uniref:hypothetical protein n=1 Tax=unclassified Micromonospora TaxID=2617518 RepID=UPI001B37F627|nr:MULTISPECIES: hypothetical protein [unclassified Micromonospora]MBQ0980052.1 hypothetical protein [Micromonospora sp. M61]MBQ1036060.1 hypothetical protein [Micromonospora sp. C81]
MNYRELFDKLHRRPGMFGLDGSFGQFTAFLQGYWMADAPLLDGWREWLVIQFDAGNNLMWQALARRLATPEEYSPLLPLDHVQNRAASDALFRLLDRFLTERESSGGASAIKAAHQAWMERQSWYRPEGLPTSTVSPGGAFHDVRTHGGDGL